MNIFKQRAEEYLGKSFKDNLSRTDRRRLIAKVKKMKTSWKKAQRYRNDIVNEYY